jgi:hypothetical protein
LLAIIGGLALLAVLGIVAVLAGWIGANPTPTPSGIANGSSTPGVATTPPGTVPPTASTSGVPTDSATPTDSAIPTDTATPTDVPPTATATLIPTATPTQPVPTPTRQPPSGFSCETQALTASEQGRWRVVSISRGTRSAFDYFALNLERMSGGAGTVGAEVNLVPKDEVFNTYGVDGPTLGDIALVLYVNNPIKVSAQSDTVVNFDSLEEWQMTVTSEGLYSALGVSGSGCFSLSAPGWDDPSVTAVSVNVFITNR